MFCTWTMFSVAFALCKEFLHISFVMPGMLFVVSFLNFLAYCCILRTVNFHVQLLITENRNHNRKHKYKDPTCNCYSVLSVLVLFIYYNQLTPFSHICWSIVVLFFVYLRTMWRIGIHIHGKMIMIIKLIKTSIRQNHCRNWTCRFSFNWRFFTILVACHGFRIPFKLCESNISTNVLCYHNLLSILLKKETTLGLIISIF
jgi:hypothetical protein